MMPTKEDEKRLITEVIRGNSSAFDALYWRYYKVVYLNIVRLVKDKSIANDILQEVFAALWIKRESLNPEKLISGWLFTTSYRKCINYLKSGNRKLSIRRVISEVPDRAEENEEQEEQEERFRLLGQAISNLSPRKKKVFELCKLEGKSYEEAADELNISKYTVKEYITTSMTSIRAYIQVKFPHTLKFVFWAILICDPPFFS